MLVSAFCKAINCSNSAFTSVHLLKRSGQIVLIKACISTFDNHIFGGLRASEQKQLTVNSGQLAARKFLTANCPLPTANFSLFCSDGLRGVDATARDNLSFKRRKFVN